MKIAICEDEKFFSDRLCDILKSYFEKRGLEYQISVFTDTPDLSEQFDIMFLDISLENSDGVEIARQMRNAHNNIPIIFVTSMENRVFEGYDVSAFDFVVKNTMEDKIPKVLDRYFDGRTDVICINSRDNSTIRLGVCDIIYIEPDGRGSHICTVNEHIRSTDNVVSLCKSLGAGFVECYKSIFVRVECIKRVDSQSLTLTNSQILPVSRRNRKSVLSAVISEVQSR